jgi:predicted amidohydrolase YtcJ
VTDRTVYRNGRIYSADAREATAMLVEDGVIAWIGDDAGFGIPAGAEVVDLADAFVTPAFVDAHVHCTATGLTLTGLDLSGTRSLGEALAAVEANARARRGRPILGTGWDERNWPEQRPPTAAELDRAGYGGAVYLARVDAHSAVVSSALLATADVTGLPGYRPDGWLTTEAHDTIRRNALAALTETDIRDAQRAALRHAASLGIACVHEMAGPSISSEADLTGLLALSAQEPLPQVVGYWGELLAVDKARELGAVGAAGDLFCDGSLGSHTAALSQPYADRPDTTGVLRYEVADLAEHLVRCTEAGMQAGFHAIGDAAVDQVLDAVEVAARRQPRVAGSGHRLEHAEMVGDPARLAAAGLLASVQPMFDALWGGPAGMYAQRLGPQRAAGLNRFAELAAAGVALAFGSDSPVTPLGPWAAMRAAAAHTDHSAAISPRAAFTAHTRAGWRAAGMYGEGALSVGGSATFAVWAAGEVAVDAPDERVQRWSTDPRAAVPGLPDLSPGAELPVCLQTVLRGTTIHRVSS